MSWVTVTWSFVASACSILAAVHLMIWGRERRSWANLFFATAALSTAGLAFVELVMMLANTPQQHADAVRWAHFFVWLSMIALVAFVRVYMQSGRAWLAWTIYVGRTILLLLNFLIGQNLTFLVINRLDKIQLLGESVSVVGDAVRNPLAILAQLSTLLFIIFVIDAAITVVRRKQRELMVMAVGIAVFVLGIGLTSVLWAWGLVRIPLIISPVFMVLIIVMAVEMSFQMSKTKALRDGLRQKEEWIDLAAASSGMGFWWWDYKTGRIWVTDKTRSLYGFPPQEEIGAGRFYKSLHPDDHGWVARAGAETFRKGSVIQAEYRVVLPDQNIRWILVRAQAYLNPSGQPDRMMGVSMDITAHKLNEGERMTLRNELAHLARVLAMNELSTSLAHEINQPLGAIYNSASTAVELLSQRKEDHTDLNEILADITQAAQRASDVVRKIRGMVKREEVRFEPLDVNALLKEVVELLQNRIKISNVALDMVLQTDLPNVAGDRVQIQQVMMNVITNALDAMATPPKSLKLRSFLQAPDRVTVSVSDSGPGIDAAVQEKMFKPFFSTKKSGLGVGLSICRSILDLHGGRIWAENDPTAGAVFFFTLKIWEGDTA